VLKPGMIFGRGDHMLDHLSHALYTFPLFVGLGPMRVRPLAVADVVTVLRAALVDARLARRTVALVGPTELGVQDAVALVAEATGRRRPILPLRLGPHYTAAAWLLERLMTVPMLSTAQVRILREEVVEPTGAVDPLPADLVPSTPYDLATVRAGLPAPGRFGPADLRWCAPAVAR
jgi:NADH dehydrogenase